MKKIIRNFLYNLRRNVREYLRRRSSLLLIQLQEGTFNVSFWQNRQKLWQEQDDYFDFFQLEEKLRQLLLARDIEENISALVLPAPTMLHEEELSMPLLTHTELKRAMAWEAQNCVNWKQDSYCYTYIVQYIRENAEARQQVKLFVMQNDVRTEISSLCQSLLLRLQGICAQDDGEAAAQAWYLGNELPFLPLGSGKILTSKILPGCTKYLPRTACYALLLSVLAYAGAWGGCLLAQKQLQSVQRELADLNKWQQRQAACKAVDTKINKLEAALAKAQKQPEISVSRELENLGKLIVPGCWLLRLERTAKSDQLALQGKAVDNLALQAFVEALQEANLYKKVELLQTKQGRHLEYSLRLQTKAGDKL